MFFWHSASNQIILNAIALAIGMYSIYLFKYKRLPEPPNNYEAQLRVENRASLLIFVTFPVFVIYFLIYPLPVIVMSGLFWHAHIFKFMGEMIKSIKNYVRVKLIDFLKE
jgi:hypothetical protein